MDGPIPPQDLTAQQSAARTEIFDSWARLRAQAEQGLAATWGAQLDGLLRRWFAQLSEEAAQAAAAAARRSARLRVGEDLNQAVRRLRGAETTEQVSRALLDGTAPFCSRAAILAVSGGHVQGLFLRGVEAAPAREAFESLDLPLADAPALADCAASREPVVTLGGAREVSPALQQLFHHQPDERVHVFPVVVRGEAAALLYAADGERAVEPAPVELLAQVAGAAAEALLGGIARSTAETEPEPEATSALVQIALPPPPAPPPDWSVLDPAEQEMHLKARRFARAEVAEIRARHADAVREGLRRRDLYEVLEEPIEQARERFSQKFLAAVPSMVDYFHFELIRGLAQDHADRLGSKYPGPLKL